MLDNYKVLVDGEFQELVSYTKKVLGLTQGTVTVMNNRVLTTHKLDEVKVLYFDGSKVDSNGVSPTEGDIIKCKFMYDWNIPEAWNSDNSPKYFILTRESFNHWWLKKSNFKNFTIVGNINTSIPPEVSNAVPLLNEDEDDE